MLSRGAARTTAEATAIQIGLVLIDDAVETRLRTAGASETQRKVAICADLAFQALGTRTAASAAIDIGLAFVPEPVRAGKSSTLVAVDARTGTAHSRTGGAGTGSTSSQGTARTDSTGTSATTRGSRT
jgi:hypothetical protein